jgi:hypothetical protein
LLAQLPRDIERDGYHVHVCYADDPAELGDGQGEAAEGMVSPLHIDREDQAPYILLALDKGGQVSACSPSSASE